VHRFAFGFTGFRDYRIRPQLDACKPNLALIAALSPPSAEEPV